MCAECSMRHITPYGKANTFSSKLFWHRMQIALQLIGILIYTLTPKDILQYGLHWPAKAPPSKVPCYIPVPALNNLK